MATIGLNLPQLQNLIKRDPLSYRDDFFRQLRHMNSMMEILQLNPSEEVDGFGELLMFLAHVSHCYKSELDGFPEKMLALLRQQYQILHPEMRQSLAQALMLLRTRKLIDQMELLVLFLSLLRCRDKALRSQLHTYIVSDLKASNQRCKNGKLNKAIQNRMFDMVNGGGDGGGSGNEASMNASDGSDIAAKLCLDICIDLYRRNIWNDTKTVNIIASACFSMHNKVLSTALKFFLGNDKAEGEDGGENGGGSDDEAALPDMQKLRHQAVFTKNSKNRQAKIDRAMKTLRRKQRKSEKAEHFNFSAIHLLNDPQGMAEKLFLRLTRSPVGDAADGSTDQQKIKIIREVKFEIRLMIMNFISRLIGLNKLILLGFYSYVIRYLKPHQPEVTHILAYCAQASHDLIPPDALESLLRVIMDNFVSDCYASEVIACGINSIREICNRCPLAMTSEIMGYILSFKSHRDKGVTMAVRSVIKLFRDLNPLILPKRERGKVAAMDVAANRVESLRFGQRRVAEGVDGAELLLAAGAGDDDDKDAWDVEGEGDDSDEEGWIKVDSDSDNDDISIKRGSSDGTVDDSNEFVEEEWEEESMMSVDNDFSGSDDEATSNEGEDEQSENESSDEDDQMDESGGAALPAPTSKVKSQRLETQRILTPADFARMKRLREESMAEHMVDGKKRSSNTSAAAAAAADQSTADADPEFVSPDTILGPRKKQKMNREERIACIMEGRKDREKFGSRKGKDRGSITNREKSKRKNMVMMSHKRGVLQKKKMSLRDKQRRLRKHIDHQKKQI